LTGITQARYIAVATSIRTFLKAKSCSQ